MGNNLLRQKSQTYKLISHLPPSRLLYRKRLRCCFRILLMSLFTATCSGNGDDLPFRISAVLLLCFLFDQSIRDVLSSMRDPPTPFGSLDRIRYQTEPSDRYCGFRQALQRQAPHVLDSGFRVQVATLQRDACKRKLTWKDPTADVYCDGGVEKEKKNYASTSRNNPTRSQ